ncbi:hypothetical protein IMSAG049_00745 [Clostridiales bacterium]|nr:hypothetical protein IMSAG049_00745 [Clostridiales bacterium]
MDVMTLVGIVLGFVFIVISILLETNPLGFNPTNLKKLFGCAKCYDSFGWCYIKYTCGISAKHP